MRNRTSLSREPVTRHFRADCKSALELPVGLMDSPKEKHGWGTINPDQTGKDFIPYAMVSIGQGVPEGGSIGDSTQIWVLTYRVTLAGVTHSQTEVVADKLRFNLPEYSRQVIKDERNQTAWKIMEYSCIAIGDVNRITGLQPEYFVQTDTYQMRVSKGKWNG